MNTLFDLLLLFNLYFRSKSFDFLGFLLLKLILDMGNYKATHKNVDNTKLPRMYP